MKFTDDLEGAKDYPLVSRYPGSKIMGYSKSPFDETDLIAGKYAASAVGGLHYEQCIHVEGSLTRIVYVFPPDRSALDVMRNYTDAIRKANMSIVFSCDKTGRNLRRGATLGQGWSVRQR